MKKKVIAALLCVSLGFTTSTEYPSAKITNGLITATLHLPDAQNGYYRGTRFDWSGVMPSLEYKGHQYFGLWNPAPYDPQLHDAITGPVEEFTAVGMEEAATGGEFVKIGIGSLVKPDEKAYTFVRNYEIKNPGTWTVKKKKDGEPTGPNISTTFPYEVSAEGKGFGTIAEAQNKSITYNRTLAKGENVFTAGVQGIAATAENYDFTIRNLKSGAGVHIKGDQPLEKLVYWSNPNTSCPEPYIRLSAQPGETIRWNITYAFSIKP